VRLAQLRQLSGNIAGAADSWLSAARADPNDGFALVSGAYCLAAVGEWEKAASALLPLLAAGRPGPSTLEAHFLNAFFKIRNSSDASTLAALAGDSEFVSLRPMIYYTLWQMLARNPAISGAASAETWKSRLLAEFPQSPEARAADISKQKDALSISAVQSPLWMLFPGATGFSPVAAEKPTSPTPTITPPTPAPVTPTPLTVTPTPLAVTPTPLTVTPTPLTVTPTPLAVTPTPTVTPTAPPPTPPKPAETAKPVEMAKPVTPTPSPAVSVVVLQTGLFSKEANARAQIETLRKAGFSASASRKLVNGTEYWAVTVPAGQDSKKTIADLKKAGFDSFPVKL
jgi:hypothetical protein